MGVVGRRFARIALAVARTIAVAATVVLVMVLALVAGRALAVQRETAAAAQPRAALALAATATFDNAVLGYSMELPSTYRRVSTLVASGPNAFQGRDTYTSLSVAEERAACAADTGDVPPTSTGAYLHVESYSSALPALSWIAASPLTTPRSTVTPVAFVGGDAVRINEEGRTGAFVVHAGARTFVVIAALWPSPHPLDAILASFRITPPSAAAVPPPAAAPRDAAAARARDLAAAFAARDAGAVAALMAPCRIGVSAVVEPVQRGREGCCGLNRSAIAFISALRQHLARGELAVTVDPQLLTQVDVTAAGTSEWFYVHSEWVMAGMTRPVDLYIGRVDGQWYWTQARHHYAQQELINRGTCVPYSSPWVAAGASC